MKTLLFLFFISCFFNITSKLKGQEVNLGDALKLSKIMSIKIDSYIDAESFKIKSTVNDIYLLGNDYITNNNALLFRANLLSGKIDTFFLTMKFPLINVSDYSVYDNELMMMINGEFLCYDLVKKTYSEIKIHTKTRYSSFYRKDINSVYLYDWRIGANSKEEKNIIEYNLETDIVKKIEPITLTGINFLAITKGLKYIDVNNNAIVRVKASEYKLYYRKLNSNSYDTINRILDSSNFISEKYIEKLHFKYSVKPSYSIFDSLDNHCDSKSQIYSVKLLGDSILFIVYGNMHPYCYYQMNKTTRYLDIWRYNENKKEWILKNKNIRLDNHSKCEKSNIKLLKKDKIFFSLAGWESEWFALENYLIMPKIISEKVDLDGDLSYYYSPESRKDKQYIHFFIFSLNE